ncbi:MAG TPA: hypothetical protein VFP43_25215, partial [Mesorhizobium sp.]|nr:hypothetical protein [Mesorhizobium sp.]
MKKTKFFIHPLSAASIISGIALAGTWCAPGIREGGGAGAGRVAETRLEIVIRGPGPLRGSPAPAEATAGAPTIGQDH